MTSLVCGSGSTNHEPEEGIAIKLGAVVRHDQPRPARLDLSDPGNGLPAVIVRSDILLAMYTHAEEGYPKEIGGYITGLPLVDSETGLFATYLEQIVPAQSISTRTHVTMLPESMGQVDEVCRETGTLPVGYYHSHPGFGVFQSGEDLDTFQRFHGEPYRIAVVVDSTAADPGQLDVASAWIGFFAWNQSQRPTRLPATNIVLVENRPSLVPPPLAEFPPAILAEPPLAGPPAEALPITDQAAVPPAADQQRPASVLTGVAGLVVIVGSAWLLRHLLRRRRA